LIVISIALRYISSDKETKELQGKAYYFSKSKKGLGSWGTPSAPESLALTH